MATKDDILDLLQESGAQDLGVGGSGHHKYRLPNGSVFVFANTATNNGRSWNNALSQLRRGLRETHPHLMHIGSNFTPNKSRYSGTTIGEHLREKHPELVEPEESLPMEENPEPMEAQPEVTDLELLQQSYTSGSQPAVMPAAPKPLPVNDGLLMTTVERVQAELDATQRRIDEAEATIIAEKARIPRLQGFLEAVQLMQHEAESVLQILPYSVAPPKASEPMARSEVREVKRRNKVSLPNEEVDRALFDSMPHNHIFSLAEATAIFTKKFPNQPSLHLSTNIYTRLTRLVREGKLEKPGHGMYSIPKVNWSSKE